MLRKMIALAVGSVAAVGIVVSAPSVQPPAPVTAASMDHTALDAVPGIIGQMLSEGGKQGVIVDVTEVPVPSEAKYRGDTRAIVTFANQETVDKNCGTLPGMRVIACVSEIGQSVMTLPNPCDEEFQGEDYASVVCHEKGHTLGWHHEDPHVYGRHEVHAA